MSDSQLTKGLTEQQKDEFTRSYAAGAFALEQIRKVLMEKYAASRSKQFNKDNYKMASWSEFQADSIGEQRALLYVINNILPGEKTNG